VKKNPKRPLQREQQKVDGSRVVSRILEVRQLSAFFYLNRKVIKAVDNVNLYVDEGETVGLAGESGCGKSTLASSVMQLIPHPGRIVSGEILFRGQELLKCSEQVLQDIRGNRLSLIFQDPSSYLNPTVSIGMQICDVIMAHTPVDAREAKRLTVDLLGSLGIPEPVHRFHSYPHELSGGMKQRVLIAMAISCDPDLVIADEPTTALDVTIQRQILELIKEKVIGEGSSLLFITHDLSILAEICDRIYTMYAGRVVETASTVEFFHNPLHPYTRKLLSAIPRHDVKKPLAEITGSPPRLDNLPPGCSFYPRCDLRSERCLEVRPELRELEMKHWVSCHNV
jgi:oligopeptide/dipeptide ABC transporter ATP-binding protein